jgi:hypothetical protein
LCSLCSVQSCTVLLYVCCLLHLPNAGKGLLNAACDAGDGDFPSAELQHAVRRADTCPRLLYHRP